MRNDDLRQMIAGTGRPNAAAPLRIIHVIHRPAGDILRHVADLVEAQHKAGNHVGLLCDTGEGDGSEAEAFARLDPMLALGLIRAPMRREITNFRAALALADRVRILDPDVLHGHGAKGGAYARTIGTRLRASGSRVSRIYTPHGGRLHSSRRLALSWERTLARFTDAFIFVSEYERDLFFAKIAHTTRPVAVAYNGLRPDDFAPVIPATAARDFAFIGDLRNVKGADLFIGAIALIGHRTGKAPTAAIVGTGPEEQKYRAVVTGLGLADDIEFHTARPARDAMTLARTVVVPSRVETMPYIVLDAVAAGMPLVATNVGGVAEIFGNDAERLVPPNDVTALADAMSSVLAAPGAALAKAAALNIRIRAIFTVEAMAATVDSIYRALTPQH
ncbi:MAG TPA: glycosyltransferase family 4 protein [Bauldia sp.]|nr:glycosyltransferase family 4 protein [Bauldia sp.]